MADAITKKTPHRWKPGETGNAKGRPPDARIRELRYAFLDMCPEAKRVIVDALTDEDSEIRLKAANMILDRGMGKPAQLVGEDPENRFQNLSELPSSVLHAMLAEEVAKEAKKK